MFSNDSNLINKFDDTIKPSVYSKYLFYDDKGYIHYDLIYDRIEIIKFFVKEEYRGLKIGYKLLEKLVSMYNNISLEVKCSNKKAISLYECFGFINVKILKNYYNGEDGYLMVRDNKDIYILGIESSCDETSVSIVKNGIEEINTVTLSQISTHTKYGGVIPEIASRMHTECITLLLDKCLKNSNMSINDIDYIAATYAPGLNGSLLVGLECAKTLSYIHNIPLIPTHHIKGHIMVNKLVYDFSFPIIALVVSGGHTDLILMNSVSDYEYLGSTLDDAIGEAYDKVARVLKIPYPGGVLLDKLSYTGKESYKLPLPLDDDSFNFSFSGIKSAVINLVNNELQKGNEIVKEDIAYSFQHNTIDVIVKKTMKALKKYNINTLAVAGGVSANSYLRDELLNKCDKENIKLLVPPLKYCGDNATMIACCAYYELNNSTLDIFEIDSIPSKKM